MFTWLVHADCMEFMRSMPDGSVDFTLTDIPYEKPFIANTERKDLGFKHKKYCVGIRTLNKGLANTLTFSLDKFIPEVLRVTRGSMVIFCGIEQLSRIAHLCRQDKGLLRLLIWEKSNPIPLHGQYAYLSGLEQAIFFRKPYATFNAHCKLPLFHGGKWNNQIHPTEKNHKVLGEIIEDNTNPGDIVFDPCSGSCSTGYVARNLGRSFIGCERHLPYYRSAWQRLAHELPVRNSLLDGGMCS